MSSLLEKLPTAEAHLEELEEYLTTIEETVIQACAEARLRQDPANSDPIDGEKLIEQWKVMEKEWLEKVVDIKQHEDLVSHWSLTLAV